MTDDQNRPALSGCDIVHLAQAFFLKLVIADSQDFVNDKNLWFEVSCHSKCKAHIHSR